MRRQSGLGDEIAYSEVLIAAHETHLVVGLMPPVEIMAELMGNRKSSPRFKGANTFKAGRQEELALHPTVKPVQMIADAIKDVSGRGDIVLDIFGGSGSTLIAAHRTGRVAYLCELDPIYCDRIIARYEIFAKDEAQLLACGIERQLAHRMAAE